MKNITLAAIGLMAIFGVSSASAQILTQDVIPDFPHQLAVNPPHPWENPRLIDAMSQQQQVLLGIQAIMLQIQITQNDISDTLRQIKNQNAQVSGAK